MWICRQHVCVGGRQWINRTEPNLDETGLRFCLDFRDRCNVRRTFQAAELESGSYFFWMSSGLETRGSNRGGGNDSASCEVLVARQPIARKKLS